MPHREYPLIGSNVGGFPEILEADAIVRPNDVKGLAECMVRLAASPARLAEMSAHNLERAADFHANKLALRQSAYYAAVRELFENWWRQRLCGARSHLRGAGAEFASSTQQTA